MKKLFIGILCLGALTVATRPITVVFDPSPQQEVVGYKLAWGTQSGIYTNVLNVGKSLTNQISNTNFVLNKVYYLVAVAYTSGPGNFTNSPPTPELVFMITNINQQVPTIVKNPKILEVRH